MSNILNAVFDGSRRKAITCPLFQYDYGQILKISGVELPASYQVQFSNTEDAGVSKTMLGDAEGVQIPDEYLLTGDYIYAFVYLHETEDDGETEYVIEIPVIRRPVPSEETPTPAEQSLIDQLLEQLNQGVEAAEAAADQAGEAAETAVAGMIDDTLTIQGKAADAKKTGDEISQLKSDLADSLDNITSGKDSLLMYSDWTNGFWTNTGFNVAYKYRVSTEAYIKFDYPIKLECAEGFRYICLFYDSEGAYERLTGFRTTPYIIPANTNFNITIAKVEEDTSVTADIKTFVSAITFDNNLQTQIDNIDIYGITNCEKLPITQVGYYINTSGNTVDITMPTYGPTYNYIVADCTPGEKFTINASGGSAPRAWAFIDGSGNNLASAQSTVTVHEVVEAPDGATKLIINDNGNNVSYRGIVAKYYVDELNSTTNKTDSLKSAFDYETGYDPIPVTYPNKYIPSSATIVDITRLVNYPGFNSYLIPCSFGDIFTINALGGSDPQAWVFIDISGNVLRKTRTADVVNCVEIAPKNSAYLVINDKGGRTSFYGKTVAQTLTDDVTGTDYMQKAIRRITGELKAKSPLGNLLVFGFNTDQHIRDDDNKTVTYPVLRGLRALSKLTQAYPYDFVCLGGDACEAGSYAVTPELILDECVTIQKPLYDAWCPVVPITGNHDAAQNNNTITGAMLFNAHFKRVANSGYLKGWDSTHTNGYIDFASHKIRVIFVDTTLRTDYTAEERQQALTTMLASTPQDYAIITISHHALNNTLGTKWGTIIAYQSILADYASRIICCLSGHCHCDLSATSGGILYIGTTLACCANDIDENARTIDSENETSFDNFVVDQTSKMIYALRYGYGSNRTFDYDSNSATFGEIV